MAIDNTKYKVAPGEIDYDKVRAAAGNTNEALGNVPKGPIGSAGNPYQDMGQSIGTGGYASGRSSSSAVKSSSSTSSPYQDQLNQLKQAQLSAAMAGLDKSKNASLSNLSAEKATIEPLYQKEKMQAGVTAQQTARSFGEYMAQRGGGAGASGIGGQGELLNLMGYQKNYGELGQAETSALTENARRVTDVGNAYNSDVASASAGVEAEYLKNYMQQSNLDRTYNQQNDQFSQQQALASRQVDNQSNQWSQGFNADQTQRTADNDYRRQAADLAATQFERQFGLSVGEAIGNYQGNPTLAAKAQQIQQAQFEASQAQNESQFSRQLASSNANAAASRSSKAITQSSAQGKGNMDDAMIEIDNQLSNGTSPGNVANSIEQQRETLAKRGINVDTLIKAVWDKAGLQTKPEAEDSWR